MSRKDKMSQIQETMAEVKRLVGIRIAQKVGEDPTRLQRLVEAGLIDGAALDRLPDDVDFETAMQQLRDRLGSMARSEPSVLARLDVRPLDVLVSSKPLPIETSSSVSLAVMFSDLEGFTAFTSNNGDREASAMLHDHYEAVDAIVRGRGGAVVKTIGDGHMLSFTEESAAVLAGCELADINAGPLRVRAGGHSGELVTAPGDLFGHVVNVASRVTGLARGGESLITAALRDHVGPLPGVEFESAKPVDLRGIEDPVEVCRVRRR